MEQQNLAASLGMQKVLKFTNNTRIFYGYEK